MAKADPNAVADAFADFLATLEDEAVRDVVGERLHDWAENSARLSGIVAEMARNAAARGDIADEDMPHRVWLRRQVGQGWVMMVKLKAFMLETEEGKTIGVTVGLSSGIATLLAFLGSLIL